MAELYHSYLLRLRYVDNGGQPTWLITLERPGQGTQERFSDLTALLTFLHRTMALVDTGSAVTRPVRFPKPDRSGLA